VPRALAIVNGGNALATVVATPMGAYLGSVMGWRGAFLCLVPVSLIALDSTVGGVLFDASGYAATFMTSAALLVVCAGLTVIAAR